MSEKKSKKKYPSKKSYHLDEDQETEETIDLSLESGRSNEQFNIKESPVNFPELQSKQAPRGKKQKGRPTLQVDTEYEPVKRTLPKIKAPHPDDDYEEQQQLDYSVEAENYDSFGNNNKPLPPTAPPLPPDLFQRNAESFVPQMHMKSLPKPSAFRREPLSLPTKIPPKVAYQIPNDFPQKQNQLVPYQQLNSYFQTKSVAPLPTIARTENINDIFQTKLESTSIKAFKEYFVDKSGSIGKIECIANSLVTDAHIYELGKLNWSNLETIRIRACPHLTPYVMNYAQTISNNGLYKELHLNIELMLHAHNVIENKGEIINKSIAKLEQFLGKSKKESITKILIYHADNAENSLLSSQKMILTKFQNSKDDSPMLLNHFSSKHEQCRLSFIECANFDLFDELCNSFHPQVIYIVISNIDDLFRCLFSVDSTTSFSILNNKTLRLIMKNTETNEKFFSEVYSKLNNISKSANELYTKFIDDTSSIVSENDDFRRNHYLTSLLHIQTKCEMLLKKLTPDECLIFKYNDPRLTSHVLIEDAVKYCKSLHTFDSISLFNDEEGKKKIHRTNETMAKLINEIKSKTDKEAIEKIALVYCQHRLVNDIVLDINSKDNNKSYVISDIEWLCHTINSLFKVTPRTNRKTATIFEQFKHIIGDNTHFISKRDISKLNNNSDEVSFIQWLISSWNIAYQLSIDDQNDNCQYMLFNSISSKPPVPLDSVWSQSWPTTEYESSIYFHLLQPCDPSILYRLYKLFPSQKLLLAAHNFLLIQEGAIEILVQYHNQTTISLTSRSLNLNNSKDKTNKSIELVSESFDYVLRNYYALIWSFLIKNDYGFKIDDKSKEVFNSFDEYNGNALMNSKWRDLALYHYSWVPTLSSVCSICGLRPAANKHLYDACQILSPTRLTTRSKPANIDDKSGLLIIELDETPIAYTGKTSMHPDRSNSFEVIFLHNDNEDVDFNSKILSSIQIGCLVNNFEVADDETVLFQYGSESQKKKAKVVINQDLSDADRASYLEEIRNFGGFKGLRASKQKVTEKQGTQELYNGLRLRIDIFFTAKPNIYEIVFSINNVPWSSRTVKRRSTRTIFQPTIRSTGLQKSEKSMNLIVHHHKSSFDNTETIPRDENLNQKNSPWKVGMRLEARDRKNPSIIAIANIIEVYSDNRIRINFDGWTSTYDYTAEVDNGDFHPCGYWEYVQRVLYKNPDSGKIIPHFTYTRYDKPKSYDGHFSWRNYLTEIDAEPVPFECFNYVQTEGMTAEYFPHSIVKTAFTNLSCRHHHNVRVKYQKMNTFIQNEIVHKLLREHNVIEGNNAATTRPGAILLPTPFDVTNFQRPCLKHFENSSNFVLHLTCNHRSLSPFDSSTFVSGAHLLDTEGIHLEKKHINTSVIGIGMLTAIDLARNQKHRIATATSKLILNNNKSLDKQIIDFYMRRWLELSAYITCFHSTSFHTTRSFTSVHSPATSTANTYIDQDLCVCLRSGLRSIDINSLTNTLTQKESQFGKFGECYYCSLFRRDEIEDKSDIQLSTRMQMIGDYASSIFYFELYAPEKNLVENHLMMDDNFFRKFDSLEIIDITNIVIDRFQLDSKNRDALTHLTYLKLENNDLTSIEVDFYYFNNLSCIKFIQNPLESLPLNCFTSKSLQYVELGTLGRLTEIDSNIRFSPQLETLIMTESVFATLPQTLGTDARTQLKKLTLNGVTWWGYRGISVNEVIKYESFEKRFIPFLDVDEITKIYHMYDEDANGILSFSEINLMNAHIYRYISRLRAANTKMPNSGRSSIEPTNTNELDIIKQDSFVTDPSGFPTAIFYLENLTELNLICQGIKSVPDPIKNLKNLSILNLSYCIELETVSPEVGFLPLRELNLTGCASLKTPPAEIIRRGHTQTMAFLQRLISGSTACKRTKLMLVGLGGAGKTSLVRRFLKTHSGTPPMVTDGIDILKWKVPLDRSGEFLEFSVWDFAGQSVYYHTHQFFLAKKAIYVLAWNIRLGAEHAGLDFWLSSICCHAPNAPIFVVGTHLDQVARVDLRQDDLMRRYPQIAGFFNVSTHTDLNMNELIDNMIATTLALPYMDEQIPKVWLKFESLIAECKSDILPYNEVSDIAHNAGIFEPSEVLQAVQFLHDLGSLQYFPSEQLKNHVVINPQWIVNVMACIVSIKDSPVKNGRLYHNDMDVIWKDYPDSLHPWILKLTEAFDLTFPVPDQSMNLVPCLLPEEEPDYAWIEDAAEAGLKEMKVVYKFNYLPAGLFNRAQVRLFQFSDKSTIWRYGSLLVKNNHRAVVIRNDDRHIIIHIQGIRPDNVLFLIHEVFEGLVNESFFGVTYDISFPCPDCVELRTNEPWQFSSSLINRAIELKSPSIQCHRFFHVASVTDLQAIIPPDSNSNYDLHLEYSVRDLKTYKQNMTVDVVYIYSLDHIPIESEIMKKVDPRKIKDDLTRHGLAVWTPESIQDFKIENHFLVMKEAKTIIFGISTELIDNPKNRNLYEALQTINNILRKPIIPLLFGNDTKWKESDIGVSLADRLYVNMQKYERYEQRFKDLVNMIQAEKSNDKSTQLRDQPTDVFISYCWVNSHDAVNKGTKPTPTSIGWGDPRVLKDYLEGRGLKVWMDISRIGKTGVLHDIVHGLKNTRLVIACVSDEYTQSDVCRNEFLFAKNTLRLPVILSIFGVGDKWRTTEVGMCSLSCAQVNFQFENPGAFEDVYNLIKANIPKDINTTKTSSYNNVVKPGSEENITAAYQELFELTQRKFLRLITGFADSMTVRPYPRLFAVDFLGEKEKSAQELERIALAADMNAQQKDSSKNDERDLEAERLRDEEVHRKQMEISEAEKARRAQEEEELQKEKEQEQKKEKSLCIRVLCENEENWHPAGNPFQIAENITIQNSASYLSRIMILLKHSELPLEILATDEGDAELQKLSDLAKNMNMEVKESYEFLRQCIMDFDTEEKYCGLKQCLMPSGKILWLCEEHQKQPRVILVTGSLTGGFARPQNEEKSDIIKALIKLNERLANNELPAPVLKVPKLTEARRLSSEIQKSGRYSSRRNTVQDGLSNKIKQTNIAKIEEKDNEIISNEDEDYDDDTAVNAAECSTM